MACMTVRRAATGTYEHYISAQWVNPVRHPRLWVAYRANLRHLLATLPPGRVWAETPNHPITHRRKRRRMPDIVAKITHPDGTESAYGPVSVSDEDADTVAELLGPHEARRLEGLVADAEDAARAANAAHSAANAEANQAQIAATIEED